MIGRPSLHPHRHPGEELGFRRVAVVRAWMGDGPTTYEVDGVAHRHPRTRRVPAVVAGRLVAEGVPLVVRSRDQVRDQRVRAC